MGNHHSRKKEEKSEPQGFGPAAETLSRIEEIRGEAPDPYDKLLAWMVEMAENDDVALDSNTFVQHLENVCTEKQRKATLPAPTHQASYDSTCSSRYSKSSHSREELRPGLPTRQASYDSSCSKMCRSPRDFLSVPRQASYDSSCSSRYSRANRSPDDLLTVPVRQSSYESSSSRGSRNSRSREELLDPRTRFRRTMLSRQGTVDFSDDGDNADGNLSSPIDSSEASSFDHDSDMEPADPQSVLINGYQETSFIKQNGRQQRQYNGKTYQGLSTSVGDLVHGRINFQNMVNNKKKSKSLLTMRRIMSETRTDEEITPITEENVVTSILDDSLLDRNMADILYSVEALWPKVPK